MIDKKILEFIEKEEIEKIARETKLVMRKSTISGFDLLITFTAGLLNSPESTLSKLSLFLKSLSQKSFSYQALDKRITMKLVDFLRIILEEITKRGSDINIKKSDFLKRFSNIFIIDSTNFDLHTDLSDNYQGSGGSASSASMRIQVRYEYFSGKFKIKLGDTKLSDSKTLEKYVKEKKKLKDAKDSLFLEDLGYYSIDTFKMIDEADMYFISKIRRNTILTKVNGKLIDLNRLIKKGKTYIDTIVIMKGKKFRLVGGLLPEKQWQAKIEKIKSRNKKVLTEEEKNILKWNLFLTNVADYSYKKLFTLYRMRWQIELIFKSWKSILKINKVRNFKNEKRLLSEIYGKLIVAALGSNVRTKMKYNDNVNLSFYKLLNTLSSIAFKWGEAIFAGVEKHQDFWWYIKFDIIKLTRKSESKKKPSIESIITKMENVA